MEKTTLLMGFHCHQPVGNFHSVLRHACADCYGPLLEELARHPGFGFGFHMSGYLLEWVRQEEKGIYSLLGEMARKGQAELFTAGYFEPILSEIPSIDALEQISLFSDTLEDISGTRPDGLWLTERIWDPGLVSILREAGIRFTVIDDNHILAAGHGREGLSGYFTTERMARILALYPISQRLRYATPFKPVGEVLKAIEEVGGRGGAAVVFDDGEKFGMWPGTHEWVFEKGWLREFLSAVVESETVATGSFTEYLDRHEPVGRLHLPPGSYFEMGEWTLSPEDARLFRGLYSDLERSGKAESARRFLRGGLWPDFFLKYSESNNMHKKMIRVSERTRGKNIPEARRCLLKAQCNDAYWHGIFGGLYLPVLRNAVKRELILAERILDSEEDLQGRIIGDLNADGYREAELRGPEGVVVVNSIGGQVSELSDKKSLFDLLSTLTRRMEHYHMVSGEEREKDGEGVATIHEAMRSMDEETRRMLVFDRIPRYSFVDHFLAPGTRVQEFAIGSVVELGDFTNGLFRLEPEGMGVRANREGCLQSPDSPARKPLTVTKSFSLDGRSLSVRYDLSAGPGVEGAVVFVCELNLHFPSGVKSAADIDGRPFPLEEITESEPGQKITVADPVLPGPVIIGTSLPAKVWSYPVHTVSQSEKGFDITCQGSCLSLMWLLDFSTLKQVPLELVLAF